MNKSSVPPQLPIIFWHAKKNNSKINVTGVITYQYGWYLQLLEGDKDTISNLYELILKDDRHHSIEIIIEGRLKKPYFPKFSMKLSPQINQDKRFIFFMKDNFHMFEGLQEEKIKLLNLFIDFDQLKKESKTFNHLKKESSKVELKSYENFELEITGWPDISSGENPALIYLCGKLSGQSFPYSHLQEEVNYWDNETLIAMLDKLQEQKMLRMTPILKQNNSQPARKNNKQKKDGFFSKMKSVLGMR